MDDLSNPTLRYNTQSMESMNFMSGKMTCKKQNSSGGDQKEFPQLMLPLICINISM